MTTTSIPTVVYVNGSTQPHIKLTPFVATLLTIYKDFDQCEDLRDIARTIRTVECTEEDKKILALLHGLNTKKDEDVQDRADHYHT